LVCQFKGRKQDENGLPRRIIVLGKKKVTRGWRKFYNEGFVNPYISPDIIAMLKSWRLRWTGHSTRMGEKRKAYKVLVGKVSGKDKTGEYLLFLLLLLLLLIM
jgi:hypothetical protein